MAIKTVNVDAAQQAVKDLAVEKKYNLDLIYGPTIQTVRDFKTIDGTTSAGDPYCRIKFTLVKSERDKNGEIMWDDEYNRPMETFIYGNSVIWLNREKDLAKYEKEVALYKLCNGSPVLTIAFRFKQDTSGPNKKNPKKRSWAFDCTDIDILSPGPLLPAILDWLHAASTGYNQEAEKQAQSPAPAAIEDEDDEEDAPF